MHFDEVDESWFEYKQKSDLEEDQDFTGQNWTNFDNGIDDDSGSSNLWYHTVDLSMLSGSKAFEIAQWLYSQNYCWLQLKASPKGIEAHALRGNAEFVIWLHEHLDEEFQTSISSCTPGAITNAASAGNLELVMYLYKKYPENFSHRTVERAAAFGHTKLVMWLYEHCTVVSFNAQCKAIQGGHIDLAKWLLQNRPELDPTRAMETLIGIRHGYYKITKQSKEWLAMEKEDLEMAKWLCQHFRDKILSGINIDEVAKREQLSLPVLHFLLENRIGRWPTSTMDTAAANNQLEVVKLLHKSRMEGCTTRAMDWSARYVHLEMVRWLNENRPEGCTIRAMDSAIAHDHLDVAKYLYENRSEGASPHQIDKAAGNGHLDMVCWLTEHCENEPLAQCTTTAMDSAAYHGHYRMIRYLHENRTEGCTSCAMDRAASHGCFRSLLYLHANRSEGCTDTAFLLDFFSARLRVFGGWHSISRICIPVAAAICWKGMAKASSHAGWSMGVSRLGVNTECKVE